MPTGAEGIRRSIEDRLRSVAGSPERHARARRRFATQVLLDRLARKTDRWTLKGAFLLETRLEESGVRVMSMTRDVDVATDNASVLLEDLRTCAGSSQRDPFELRVHVPIRSKPGATTARRTVELRLAGREFERFQIDVAEQISLHPFEPMLISVEPLDDRQVSVNAQTISSALLDKLNAYSRLHSDGRRSSRTRDFPDMLHLIELAAGDVTERVTEILGGSHLELPERFPPLPEGWPATLIDRAGNRLDTGEAHARLESFWNPILSDWAGRMR